MTLHLVHVFVDGEEVLRKIARAYEGFFRRGDRVASRVRALLQLGVRDGVGAFKGGDERLFLVLLLDFALLRALFREIIECVVRELVQWHENSVLDVRFARIDGLLRLLERGGFRLVEFGDDFLSRLLRLTSRLQRPLVIVLGLFVRLVHTPTLLDAIDRLIEHLDEFPSHKLDVIRVRHRRVVHFQRHLSKSFRALCVRVTVFAPVHQHAKIHRQRRRRPSLPQSLLIKQQFSNHVQPLGFLRRLGVEFAPDERVLGEFRPSRRLGSRATGRLEALRPLRSRALGQRLHLVHSLIRQREARPHDALNFQMRCEFAMD